MADYLTGHDWQVNAHPAPELYQRNGFTFPEDEVDGCVPGDELRRRDAEIERHGAH